MRNATQIFLARVLPSEGLICIALKPPGEGRGFKHFFFPSTDKAADFILEQAQTAYEIYHACASYKSSSSRKADNVQCLRSLYADVDSNEGCEWRLDGKTGLKLRTYTTIKDAVLAVQAFCRHYRLPFPLIVVSGYGLHLYWPLNVSLTLEQWLPYARALKDAFQRFNFLHDPSRTADAASVLRPVGTQNHKYSTHPTIELKFDPGVDYPLSAFDHLLNAAKHDKPRVENISNGTPFLPSHKQRVGILTDASGYYAQLSDATFRQIIDGCRQLATFEAKGGCVPEPQWFLHAGTLAPLGSKGVDFFHEISRRFFKNYNYEETENKIRRKPTETTGPTLCITYQRDFPADCKGCRFAGRIKTPLDIPEAARFIAPPSQPPLSQADVVKALHGLPSEPLDGFCYDDGGALLALVANPRGAVQSITVCSYPLYLRAVLQKEDDGTEQALLAQYRDKHWRDIPIDYPSVLGRSPADNLAKLGVNIQSPPSVFRRYITARTEQLRQLGRPATTLYTSFGYKDNHTSFLWGNRLYSHTGVEIVPVAQEIQSYERAFVIPKDANLRAWKAAIEPFFLKDFLRVHALTILGALGATLVPLIMDEAEGGCAISLAGAEGGGGKTTALIAGCSAFYFYKAADVFGRDTSNAMWGMVSALRNMPIVWDDLRIPKRKEEQVFEIMENFNHGRDKRRMLQGGELRQAPNGWQTLLFITSNTSLRALMSSMARREEKARSHRIMEFFVPVNDQYFRSSVGDKLRSAYYVNRGVGGDAFLKALFQPGVIEDVKQRLTNTHAAILERTQWPASTRYWVQALAAIQIAGEIAHSIGLVPVRPDDIVAWALDYQADTVKEDTERTRNPLNGARLMLSAIRNALILDTLIVDQSNLSEACFIAKSEPRGVPVARFEDNALLFIRSDIFKQAGYRAAGANLSRYLNELKKAGIYIGEEEIDLGRGTKYAAGAIECQVFDVRERVPLQDPAPVVSAKHRFIH